MSFSFEFLNIHIIHLAQVPMINMTLKWHHINICNKIAVFFQSPNVHFGSFDCDHTYMSLELYQLTIVLVTIEKIENV